MLQEIREFILEEILVVDNKEKFSDNANLFESGLESLSIMRLIFFLEDKFKVKIPEDRISIENFSTINDINNLVKSLLANQQ